MRLRNRLRGERSSCATMADTTRMPCSRRSSRAQFGRRADAAFVSELDEAVADGTGLRPGIEIAGDHAPVAIGEKIEALIAADRAPSDRIVQARQPQALILLDQARDLGLDGLVGLAVEHQSGVPIDEAR